MMRPRVHQNGLRAAVVAACLTLAACGAQPYPTPSEEPPPPPPPADLLGQPDLPPPPAPPPVAEAPAPLPPPPPAGELAGAPPPSPAPVVIAMAPIPNPPEPERRQARPRRAPAPVHAEPVPVRPAPRLRLAPPPSAPRTPGVAAPRPAPAVKAPAARTPAVKAPAVKAPAVKAPAVKTPAVKAPAAEGSPLGDRSARLASLEEALASYVAREGRLNAPERMTPNQPTDVTLTIPAGLADVLRDEALKLELSDAARVANVRAMLAGDGYTIAPNQPQSQPLLSGRATEFHWMVIATPGARGPLQADVGADLVGAGTDTLSLGTVESGRRFAINPRAIGAGVLVLLAALIAAWLLRGGRGPVRPGPHGTVRRRESM